MEENEVKGRKVAIDIVKANKFAVIIMVVVAIVFFVPFFMIWRDTKPIGELFCGFGDTSLALILFAMGIVAHELIHGLTCACRVRGSARSRRHRRPRTHPRRHMGLLCQERLEEH